MVGKKKKEKAQHPKRIEIIPTPKPEPIFTREELAALLEMTESFLECDHDTLSVRTIKAVGHEQYSFSEEDILGAYETMGVNVRLFFKLRKLIGEQAKMEFFGE